MKSNKVLRKAAIAAAIAATVPAAMATNGMILEGYGPISTGMGGASQAVDHGTAAMAQNPATLSMMQSNAQLDVAVGNLGPKIKATHSSYGSAESSGTAYMMPAIGYARKADKFVYGVGVYAVGGMGTEYGGNTFMASQSNQAVRSELGVGSVIFPLSYQVDSKLAVGGSLDFVWATMDLQMAMMGSQLGNLMTGGTGNLYTNLPSSIQSNQWARIDFSDGDKNSGAAKANGFRLKLGATYKVSNTLMVGGSYQAKTSLSDMKTAMGSAKMCANNGTFCDYGSITVVNFQWPAVTSIGASWQATPALMIVGDVKNLGWAEVMKNFNMTYTTDGGNSMTGTVNFALPQKWKDQTVVSLGGAYKATGQLTVRAGLNIADNPIPESYVNALFPATIKTHYTLGLGYDVSQTSSINASYVMAPAVETVTPDGSGGTTTVSHSQTNWQLMYTHRF